MRAVDRESYDELYRSAPAVWSGRPNRQLVVEGSTLPAGRALDAGCGEGADALWLAARGWQVTAVDYSTVALDRAAERARSAGFEDRITWICADLDAWTPPDGAFDLVTAHYLHSRGTARVALFERLAAAVGPDGTLLVVGHHLDDAAGDHRSAHAADHGRVPDDDGHDPEEMYAAEDVAAVLAPDLWRDVVTGVRERDPEATARTGNSAPDTVLVARRRSGAR